MKEDPILKKLPNIKNVKISDCKISTAKPARKYPGFRNNLGKYIQEFTTSTGIQGFKYIGELTRPIIERLCWVIAFGISLVICIFLIMGTWKKWNNSPVVVAFANKETPVSEIPFPAVTICPQTKNRQTAFNFTAVFNRYMDGENLTQEEMKNFSASSLVCGNHLFTGDKIVGWDAIDHIARVGRPLQSALLDCRWILKNDNCSATFTTILTEDGVCYTSNMLRGKDIYKDNVYLHNYMEHNHNNEGWSLHAGYPDTAAKDTFPRRVMYPTFPGSLILIVQDLEDDLDYVCSGLVQGFKVILHNPAEVPMSSVQQYYQAPLDQELLLTIMAEMETTSKNLNKYDSHKRECFFPDEKYLAFFKIYSQHHCELECLTNLTLKECECVAYYMPHEKSTPICGPGSLNCLLDVKFKLVQQTGEHGSSKVDNTGFECDCLPSCTSLSYNAEVSQTPYNWQQLLQGYRTNMTYFVGTQLTRITIFFKESQFKTIERNELYNLADFLAQCGGILGLFTGFSFLSLVELCYFLNMRIIFNIKRFGRHYWSGSPKLVENPAFVHD